MTIKAIVHEEVGGYWAEVPSMPGCYTQGDTMEELVSNLQEAIEGWMEVDQELRMKEKVGSESSHEIELRYTPELVA